MKFLKKILISSIGLAMAVGVGITAYSSDTLRVEAAEETVWDFTAKTTKNSNYKDTWTYGDVVEISGGANNNEGWAYIRTGGRGSDSDKIDPATMTSVNASTFDIGSVTLQALNTASGSNFTMDSITLSVSSDSNFSSIIDTVDGGEVSANMIFYPTNGTYWPTGSYFRLSFDWSGTSSSNRGMDVEKVTFSEKESNTTLDNLSVTGKNSYYTTDIIVADDFTLGGTKSDSSSVTYEDVSVSIGNDSDMREVVFGETKPLTSDTIIRFTSLLVNSEGTYDTQNINITVVDPVIVSISLSGDMTNKDYATGDNWDPTGIVATGNLNTGDTIDLTNEVVWSYNPASAEFGITSVAVTATYNGVVSNTLTIDGITVVNLISDTIRGSDVPSGNGYNSWTFKGNTAEYSILSNYGQTRIQLRSDGNNSGIVSTISGGKIKSVKIEWNSGTSSDRDLGIYASNDGYNSPSDLYNGSYIATLNSTSNETEYTFTGDYSFVGVRSQSGALYLDSITFVWEPRSSTSVLETVTLSGSINKTHYYDNEQWDGSGLSVVANYSDGDQIPVASGYELNWNPTAPSVGTNEVKVSATYEGVTSNELTFDVEVEEYVEPVWTYAPTANPTDDIFTIDGVELSYYVSGAGTISTFDDEKGLHFGTNEKPYDSVTLFSEPFKASTNETMINRIVVEASSASNNSGSATIAVKVNNAVVDTFTLNNTNTAYEFKLDTPMHGHVEILLTNDGDKAAMYVKSVTIFAEYDETSASVIDLARELYDIRSCDDGEAFKTFYNENNELVSTYEEELNNVVLYDYNSLDTSYVGSKTNRVSFMEKYNYCVNLYVANSSNVLSLNNMESNSTFIIVLVMLLGVAPVLCVFAYKSKKRRETK